MKSRKQGISVSIEHDLIDAIDVAVADVRGFSAKLELIVRQWLQSRDVMVVYKTERQKEDGEPDLVEAGAFRVLSFSSYLKGWDDKPDNIEFPKATKTNVPDIAEALKAAGFRVQVIDDRDADMLEIWAADGNETGCSGKCAYKAQMKQIRSILEDK